MEPDLACRRQTRFEADIGRGDGHDAGATLLEPDLEEAFRARILERASTKSIAKKPSSLSRTMASVLITWSSSTTMGWYSMALTPASRVDWIRRSRRCGRLQGIARDVLKLAKSAAAGFVFMSPRSEMERAYSPGTRTRAGEAAPFARGEGGLADW